jgi:hypothetical protein
MEQVMATSGEYTESTSAADMLELLVSAASGDEGSVTEVIRPAAIVPEEAARAILLELALNDVRSGGVWLAEPSVWRRFDRPHAVGDPSELIGSVQVAYGTPTKYEITVYRVTVTRLGTEHGWTVDSLTDEVLAYGGLTLAECPRARLEQPPQPFRFQG